MSWITVLVSALGIPVAGTGIAAAIVAGAFAAEREARPEALADISRIISDPSWLKGFQPAAVLRSVFELTFGKRQLSLICLRRSAIATLMFCTVFGVIVSSNTYIALFGSIVRDLANFDDWLPVYVWLPVTILIDFLCIFKTRVIIWILPHRTAIFGVLFLIAIDVMLSVMIHVFIFSCAWNFILPLKHSYGTTVAEVAGFYYNSLVSPIGMDLLLRASLASTLMTSIWIVLLMLSLLLLKLLQPLRYFQRFLTWYFPVDKHPLRAVGIAVGTLVFAASIIIAAL